MVISESEARHMPVYLPTGSSAAGRTARSFTPREFHTHQARLTASSRQLVRAIPCTTSLIRLPHGPAGHSSLSSRPTSVKAIGLGVVGSLQCETHQRTGI